MRGILGSAVARATMIGKKLLAAALLAALAVTACSSQGVKNHVNLSVTKQHLRGPQPIPSSRTRLTGAPASSASYRTPATRFTTTQPTSSSSRIR
jgi:hypothetical protein